MLKPSHLAFSSLFSIIILGLLAITTITSISPASASPVDFSVSVAPSLNVTIPTNIISLNLNPINNAFSTSNLTVSVGTNNPSGYTLTMTSTSTDLTRTEKVGDTYPVISALTSETTESNFTTNRWGYRFNDNTANTNYQPFTTNILVKEYDKAVNNDTRTITFASKIDTTQAPGTYELALNFTAVANPNLSTMQNLADAQCPTTPTEVIDSRDGTVYTIQRLADGNCWMLDNLALDLSKDSVKTNLTSTTTNALDTNLTNLKNNVVAKTATGGSWTGTYTAPYIATGGSGNAGDWTMDTDATYPSGYTGHIGKIGIYYNYCAASANTICTSSNTSNASYDICPAGWKLPAGHTSDSSFYQLYNTGYSSNVANFQTALSTPLSGYFYNAASDQGSYGGWWSSTRYDSTNIYYLGVDASNVNPQNRGNRDNGFSIRCIKKSDAEKDPAGWLTSGNATMQEFGSLSSSVKTSVLAAMTEGTTYTLKDSRDQTPYAIAKLKDGNVWMLDNLALDLSKDSVKTNLASATTNATDANLTNLKNNVIAKTADGGSWTNSYTAPYIATSGTENGGWDADTVASVKYGSGSGKIGIYYNYCAASANTICSDSNSSNASYDICPAGWRLPASYNSSGGFYYLYNTGYSGNVANFQAALSTPLSGYFYSGSAYSQGSNGGWWSSTRRNNASMYLLYVNASSVNPQNDSYRDRGFSIRCILK